MKHRSAFGIPVFTGSVQTPGFAESAVEFLRAERARDRDNHRSYLAGYSNTGWHSNAWTEANAPEPIAAFRTCAVDILVAALETLFNEVQTTYVYEAIKSEWSSVAWGVINRTGDVNFGHIHTSMARDTWAFVYYPLVPAGMRGGELRIVNPCMAYRVALGTTLSQVGAETMAIELKPTSGDYILFPGWLEHDVRPHLDEGERYALAMNLSMRSLQALRRTPQGDYDAIQIV